MKNGQQRWGWCGLIWVVCGLFAATSASAQTSAFYGPKRYDKPKGGPLTYTETIRTPYLKARYTLRVTSGEYGTQEAKNVSITLNGAEVIDPAMMRAGNPVEQPVTMQAENTLTIRMKGQGGNFVMLELLCEGCTPIRITSPLDGEYRQMPTLTVEGELGCVADGNTGVVVNGVAALIDGTRFVATHVVPDDHGGVIKANLMNSNSGVVASAQVMPAYDPSPDFVTLTSDRNSGIAPFEVKLALTESRFPLITSSVACTGPTTATVQRLDIDSYTASFAQSGLYLCTAAAKDELGDELSDSIGILVYDRVALDARLQAKWSGMKTALVGGETAQALSFMTNERKDAWRTVFERLSGKMATIFSAPEELRFDKAGDGVYEYENLVLEGDTMFSYPVRFVRDEDGILKIEQF